MGAPNVHLTIYKSCHSVVRNGMTALKRAPERGNQLRFEVNDQMFFVNFVPEEGRWYCYAPTGTGVQRIPVSMDAAPFEAFAIPMDEQAKEIVN